MMWSWIFGKYKVGLDFDRDVVNFVVIALKMFLASYIVVTVSFGVSYTIWHSYKYI